MTYHLLRLFCLFLFCLGSTKTFANQCSEFLNSPSTLSFQDTLGINPMAHAYLKLAFNESLVSQESDGLNGPDFSLASGNLCGPICLLNAYYAKEHLFNDDKLHDLRSPNFLISELLKRYSYRLEHILGFEPQDPRFGTYADVYLFEKNLSVAIWGLDSFALQMDKINFSFEYLKDSSGLLIADFTEPNSSRSQFSDTFIILAADVEKRLFYVSYPDRPNIILIRSYRIDGSNLIIEDIDRGSVQIKQLYWLSPS